MSGSGTAPQAFPGCSASENVPDCTNCASGGDCPAACAGLYPQHTTGLLFPIVNAGSTATPPTDLSITPGDMLKALDGIIASPAADIDFATGVTPASASAALQASLTAHPEWWIPSVMSAKAAVLSGPGIAPTQSMMCHGVVVTPQLAQRWLEEGPEPRDVLGGRCASRVNGTYIASGKTGASPSPITQKRAALLFSACGETNQVVDSLGGVDPKGTASKIGVALIVVMAVVALALGVGAGVLVYRRNQAGNGGKSKAGGNTARGAAVAGKTSAPGGGRDGAQG